MEKQKLTAAEKLLKETAARPFQMKPETLQQIDKKRVQVSATPAGFQMMAP